MKRFYLVILLTILISGNSHAQNLVSNPGLDNFITCPGFGQFGNTYINDWTKPSVGSSDYYNFNCPAIPPAIEFPYNGEAYAGVIGYNYGTEYREYITGLLTAPLVAGQQYTVEFYVSLHDNYIQAIEELGAYLSATVPGPFANALHIAVIPQVINTTGALDDTSGWTKVGGVFTATGGEQFITIGNFSDDPGTTVTQPYSIGSFGAYYFVDGVSVQLYNPTGIETAAEKQDLQISYNSETMTVSTMNGEAFESVILLDMTGRQVATSSIRESTTIKFSLSGLLPGTYILTATTANGHTFTRKISLIRE